MEKNRKDFVTQRALRHAVNNRHKNLAYLKRTKKDRFEMVLNDLGIEHLESLDSIRKPTRRELAGKKKRKKRRLRGSFDPTRNIRIK